MYYGAYLFTSIGPSFCSRVLLFLKFLRPEDQRRALQGCAETNNKVCQIFKEVGGAVRRESAAELENPLNLKQKRLLDIICEIYWFFSIKSLISKIQSMLGTVRRETIAWYSPTELKVIIFLSI